MPWRPGQGPCPRDGQKRPLEPIPFRRTYYLQTALEQISPFHQSAQLPVHHAALQHPETAVGMVVTQSIRPQFLYDSLNTRSDELGTFDFVVLDVSYPDSQVNFGVEIRKHGQLVITPAGKLQNEMVGVQRVQERDQIAPKTSQHGLSTVIPKADVDRSFVQDAIQHAIDRVGRPGSILGM